MIKTVLVPILAGFVVSAILLSSLPASDFLRVLSVFWPFLSIIFHGWKIWELMTDQFTG